MLSHTRALPAGSKSAINPDSALSTASRSTRAPGWEFVLTNRKDIEDVGLLFEQSNSAQEFRERLEKLKEQDLRERLERENLADDP